MKNVKICLDHQSFLCKPTDEIAGQIGKRISKHVKQLTPANIRSVALSVSLDGYAFCPATFNGGNRARESFEQTQLFVLDFHGGISYGEVCSRAKRYALPILFAYVTYSSNNNDRFRVVFLNDVPVTDVRAAEIIQSTLMTIFPESDKISSDLTRFYYGGADGCLYFNEDLAEVNLESVTRGMSAYFFDRYGRTNYKKKIAEFAKDNGVALNDNGFLDITVTEKIEGGTGILSPDSPGIPQSYHDTKMPISIILNNLVGKNVLTPSYRINLANGGTSGSPSATAIPGQRTPYRKSDLPGINKSCRLWREFVAGKRKLTDEESVGLFTNIIPVESGCSEIKDTLSASSHYYDDEKRAFWTFNLSYLNQSKYEPWGCNRFCPYRHTCQHGKNILSTAKPRRNTVERLTGSAEVETFVDIKEAEEDLDRNLTAALEAVDFNIHALNAQAGIGKSTAVLDYMRKNPELKLLNVYSTNELKNEQYEKAVGMGIDVIKSPSLNEVETKLPPAVLNHIERLRQSGKHHAVISYIKKVIAKGEVDRGCSDVLRAYINDLAAFYASDCNAFTTHSRLLTLDYWTLKKYDAVIIDEDIILHCMIPNQLEILTTEFDKILAQIVPGSDLAKKIRAAVKAAATESLFTLKSINYERAYDAISTPIDIASFCRAEKFYSKKKSDENNLLESNRPGDSIIFFKPFRLQSNIKYIILSATVSQKICNYVFGAGRVRFYNCKKARYTGTLNQNTEHTMSRADIAQNPGIITKIKTWTGVKDTITFMKYCIGKYYFGKTTGIDALKGKDLDVIGTPHQPEFLYKLFSYTLGLHFDVNAKMRYQPVRHNGRQFWFMTFDDEVLREIQLWVVGAELEQAVGRARLLRKKCTVYVFSNYPLSQATLVSDFEYDNRAVVTGAVEGE